ncbi:hypothetical protein [Streptomyces sp. NPDC001282]|uniref:hypothetical protein n=1 Tax=Streptomyces sp. NPDC001282 TaxID=3364557 RepID=UPI0036946299
MPTSRAPGGALTLLPGQHSSQPGQTTATAPAVPRVAVRVDPGGAHEGDAEPFDEHHRRPPVTTNFSVPSESQGGSKLTARDRATYAPEGPPEKL